MGAATIRTTGSELTKTVNATTYLVFNDLGLLLGFRLVGRALLLLGRHPRAAVTSHTHTHTHTERQRSWAEHTDAIWRWADALLPLS